jgi:hypothetical protein
MKIQNANLTIQTYLKVPKFKNQGNNVEQRIVCPFPFHASGIERRWFGFGTTLSVAKRCGMRPHRRLSMTNV